MDKELERALRFLGAGGAKLVASAGAGKIVLDAGERGAIAVRAAALEALARDGLAARDGDRLVLTAEGAARRRRAAAPAERQFLAQHRALEARQVETSGGGQAGVDIDLDESPLGALARRRDREGRPLLSAGEVAAGDRLRSDFTRGQMMPRLGANWQAAVASGRRDGGRGGVSDLTDAALAARLRVERALAAVGPELSGVLVDVCCFLKGLETVERERGWPARSARLLLRAGLSALSRHYHPQRETGRRQQTLHWGADGFRPQVMGGERAPG